MIDTPKSEDLPMDYVVFPTSTEAGKVGLLLDYIVAIWPSKDGTRAYLGVSLDPNEAIEVNTPFWDVMAWFDHYDETDGEEDGDVRDDLARPTRGASRRGGVQLVQTEEAGL